MIRRNLIALAVCVLLVNLVVVVSAQENTPSAGIVPHLIKFSGTVKDADGKPRTGVTGLTFALYKDQAGGAALWLETQNVTPDAQGRYTVLLGANSAEGLPVDVFSANEARWLGVQPEGLPEQRVLLVSVPYALKAADAETLGGRPASSFVLAAPVATGGSGNSGSGTTGGNSTSGVSPAATCTTPPCSVLTSGGTANFLPLFTDATTVQNSVMSQSPCPFDASQTCVGIANPNAPPGLFTPTTTATRVLDVNGEIRVGGGNIFMQRNLTDQPGRRNWAWGTETFNVGDVSLFVSTSNTAFPSQPVFTALSNSNMGIGVATPTARLEVLGNVKVSGAGNGLIFPDGTAMTSAASINGVLSASGGVLITTPGKGIIVRSPDGTKCAQIGIDNTGSLTTVAVPCPLAITATSLPTATVGTAYDQPIQTSAGDGTAITFALANSTTLPAWATLNPSTGHIKGTPAAGDVGTSAVFQISATQTGSTVTSGNLTITVVASGVNNSELNGHYAFLLRGFDPDGHAKTMGGSFTADSHGNITGGVMDANDASFSIPASALTINPAPASFYSIGADNRGMLTLNTSGGTQTFDFSVGSISSGVASLGHIISRQNTSATNGSAISGVFKKQDTTAFTLTALNGDWAYLVEGEAAGGGRAAGAGRFTLNAGTLSNGLREENINGTFDEGTTTPTPFTGSFGSIDTTNGRVLGTATFTTGEADHHIAAYIVSASEMLIMSIDAISASALVSGSQLRQSTTFCPSTGGCNFTNAAGNGIAILRLQGLGSGVAGTSYVEIDRLALTPTGGTTTGSVSVTGDVNDSGTISLNLPLGVTYTISANGRVTIALAGRTNTPVLYLVGQNTGFFLDSASSVIAGEFEPQVGPITFASGLRTIGAEPPAASGTLVFSGVQTVTATPPGCSPCTTDTLGTIIDTNSVSGGPHENVPVADDTITLDATTGRITFNSGTRVGYFINSTRRATIDIRTGNTAPNILVSDNQ